MIREATFDDILHVCKHMRKDDYEEVMANRWDSSVEAFAKECENLPGVTVVAVVGGIPVAIGGVALWIPGVGQAWMICTDEIGKSGVRMIHACKKILNSMIDNGVVHRIQAFSIASHRRAHHWLQAVGLKKEAVMPCYGKNKEDFIVFSMLGDKK